MKAARMSLMCAAAMAVCAAAAAQTAENMVFNPSFEDHTECPQRIEARGIMSDVEAWWQPTAGSSDYFHACGGRECGVPRNKLGYQSAHSGEAYCGIYCSQENYREYLQTQLSRPLEDGHTYRVSFYASLADKSPHAVATLGALLTKERLTDSTWDILMQHELTDYGESERQSIDIYYTPQVVYSTSEAITDSKGWTLVSGAYKATGGERYLTIGNFSPFNASAVVQIEAPNAILQGAYYYIDDVGVECLDCTARPELAAATLEVGDVVRLDDVFFAVGESEVLPQSFAALHSLIEMLQSNSSMRIELHGHTDSQGTKEFNQKLSEARATAVMNYLIAHGIDKRRLAAAGFGESQPIDSNDTPEGRANNRRVEYVVTRQ